MIILDPRELDKRVRIERNLPDQSFRGAGAGKWEVVDQVWAGIRDALPSRTEKDGIPIVIRRARIRMRYRVDVTSGMRIVHGDRVMQIVSAIAELGRRSGIEMMVEDYSPAGNGA